MQALVLLLLGTTHVCVGYMLANFDVRANGSDTIQVNFNWNGNEDGNGSVAILSWCLDADVEGCYPHTRVSDLRPEDTTYTLTGMVPNTWYGVCTEYKSNTKGSMGKCEMVKTAKEDGSIDRSVFADANGITAKQYDGQIVVRFESKGELPIDVTINHDVYPLQTAVLDKKNKVKMFVFPTIPGYSPTTDTVCYKWKPKAKKMYLQWHDVQLDTVTGSCVRIIRSE